MPLCFLVPLNCQCHISPNYYTFYKRIRSNLLYPFSIQLCLIPTTILTILFYNIYMSDIISLFLLSFLSKCTTTVGTCCRGGFRGAFLSEGHGTAKRESSERHTTNPAMQFTIVTASILFFYCF